MGLRVIACEATEKCACETAINLLTVCEPLRFDADHAVDTSVFRKEVLRGLDAKLPSHAAVLLSLQPPNGGDHTGTQSDRVRGNRKVCMSNSYQLANHRDLIQTIHQCFLKKYSEASMQNYPHTHGTLWPSQQIAHGPLRRFHFCFCVAFCSTLGSLHLQRLTNISTRAFPRRYGQHQGREQGQWRCSSACHVHVSTCAQQEQWKTRHFRDQVLWWPCGLIHLSLQA